MTAPTCTTYYLRAFVLLVVCASMVGCETYRVEYHTRPAYYDEAAMGGMPDRVRLDDGTVIVYRTTDARAQQNKGDRKPFKMREEMDDGRIVLRALIPEHVIANTLECLENEEYELLYREMLSEHTRLEWEGMGYDVHDFAKHFATYRGDMMRALSRMYIGMSQLDTIVEQHDNGVIECRLSRSTAQNYKFTRIRIIREGIGLKLLTIR
jgi:hypothetical protein